MKKNKTQNTSQNIKCSNTKDMHSNVFPRTVRDGLLLIKKTHPYVDSIPCVFLISLFIRFAISKFVWFNVIFITRLCTISTTST